MPPPPPASSLHNRIRDDLEARIVSGDWPIGHRIPPEHELMVQFGCSRMTVNKAVASLAADGLVIRNRRTGSFVARPQVQAAVLHIPDIQAEIEARGGVYTYTCLAVERRDACCQWLGGHAHDAGETQFIRSLHVSDGQPLMIEDRSIFLDTVPAATAIDFTTTPAGSWLLGHVPWTEAENKILAANADARIAEALAVPRGAACLVVERRTWRGGAIVTQVRQVFRGDAFHLLARFGPDQG